MIRRRDHCYWCGRETFAAKKVGPSHPACATVDHIRSKQECVSRKEYVSRENKVNACYACNHRRSVEWTNRVKSGLAHPTEWSLRLAAERRRMKIRRAKRLAMLATVPATIPPELNEAFD